jgi:4-amino-4-deoxy-L-arabinose transferase-like glycosyltransferase
MTDPNPATSIREESRRRAIPWALGIFLVACLIFGFKLASEPHFMDESAYIAQSFYADLLLDGRKDDPAWLSYAGFDIPPLPKYLVGISLRLGGYSRPSPLAAVAWYNNPSPRPEFAKELPVARIPSVLLGAIGCVAIYAIGRGAFGVPAGLVSAALLMASPLYYIHSRRAMSDVPAEALMLLALMFGLDAWKRSAAGQARWTTLVRFAVAGGLATGLAVLSKLNGAIAGMILGAWTLLDLCLRRTSLFSRLGLMVATIGAGVIAFATFVVLNPFLTAHPAGTLQPEAHVLSQFSFAERLRLIKDHRLGVSTNAMTQFPEDALRSPVEKLAAVGVQGYGRFSPLGPRHSDSTHRYEWRQDWGAVVWIPLVVAGFGICLVRGRSDYRSGRPPTAWAIAVAAVVAFVAVASFIPLAWDRYYLSLQPGAILLASAAITAPFARRSRPEPT